MSLHNISDLKHRHIDDMFGDDLTTLFETNVKKATPTDLKSPQNLSLKVCSPQWFCEIQDINDPEMVQIFKFKAEYLFFNKEYQLASDVILRCLEVLPPVQKPIRQDLRQSLAHCYLMLGKLEEARELCFQLLNESATFEQLTESLCLMIKYHQHANQILEEHLCHHRLMLLHPHDWKLHSHLVLLLAKRFQIDSVVDMPDICNKILESSNDALKECIYRILIEQRQIMNVYGKHLNSFAKEKLVKDLQKVEKSLACLASHHVYQIADLNKSDQTVDTWQKLIEPKGRSKHKLDGNTQRSVFIPDLQKSDKKLFDMVLQLTDEQVSNDFYEKWNFSIS